MIGIFVYHACSIDIFILTLVFKNVHKKHQQVKYIQ